jgi:hypothetical protein
MGFVGAGSVTLAQLQRREPVSNDSLRAIRDARIENIGFAALVDRGEVYWDSNRRLSMDSKALLSAVRNSQRLGASDRDVKWALDTVARADRIWEERYRGTRVEDSVRPQEPIAWPSTTPTYDPAMSAFGNEVARLRLYQRQLDRHNAGKTL